MASAAPRRAFALIEPGPPPPDPASASRDLFAAHSLGGRVVAAVLSGGFDTKDYLAEVPRFAELRRGAGMELAPLAATHSAAAAPPPLADLPRAALAAAFTFEAGPGALADADAGVPVDASALRSGPAAPPAAAAPAPAPARELKVKLKVGKKQMEAPRAHL
jgi:hypothetical protein